MNRTSMRQKRSIGKISPLSKRPKLDFSTKERDSLNNIKNATTENVTDRCPEKKQNGHDIIEPDWDDDFSGEMLEKVCLIADLSQAMANNQPVPPERLEKAKVQLFDGSKRSSGFDSLNPDPKSELDRLKSDLHDLQEKFKTKEGEVHILRSQLKQNEDAKQAAALQNIKVIDDIHKKYTEKLALTEKELEAVKTKLQFKDLEYKTLSDRCRQLEFTVSRNKTGEGQGGTVQDETRKPLGVFSQATQSRFQDKEGDTQFESTDKRFVTEVVSNLEARHEGKRLEEILCPEIFQTAEEPNVVHHYTSDKSSKSKGDFRKMDKYQWSNFPKQKIFLRDLYDSISGLFERESFHRKETKRRVVNIMDSCFRILNYNIEVLEYLEKLQLHHCEYDDSDQDLLENDDEVRLLTIKGLLGGERLLKEECGVEGRRTLALMYALMNASQVACDYVKSKPEVMNILKVLAELIGNLRRPLRYTGILGGITFILQRFLEEKHLDKEILPTINETVEEIIFARPKLDVLKGIVDVLASGRHHFDFVTRLCRKASLNSCSLYMDSKLKQAMFFTKNACPLKLLCMQIMGLACLSSGRRIRFELTNSVVNWLNNSMNTMDHKSIKWLPTNCLLDEEERCFDVTECLLYLLILCLKDYLSGFPRPDTSVGSTSGSSSGLWKTEESNIGEIMGIVGRGSVLLKRILKTDQRQLSDNSYSLRFAVLLRSLTLLNCEYFRKNESGESEAILWLTETLEGDSRNQDCYLKQTTLTIPEADVLSALKIDDESRIY